jgi:hypothetical protein
VSRNPFYALGLLLHLANAHPPSGRRSEFYALKDRLLRRYGALIDYDVQHIVDKCWGDSDRLGCEGKWCGRCGGTGIWRDRWIVLERWELGSWIFHRPTNLLRAPNALPRVIEGRIEHRDVHPRTAGEATLWLALLFDRPLFWRLLTTSRFCGWQWRPMLALQSVTMQVTHKFRRRSCWCGRRFWTWGSGWQICATCRVTRYAAVDDDSLPF